jgi:hypothetical protein
LASAVLRSLPAGTREVLSIGRAGYFLLQFDMSVELWDMRQPRRLTVLHGGRLHIQQVAVDGDAMIVVLPREVLVMENCLSKESLEKYEEN